MLDDILRSVLLRAAEAEFGVSVASTNVEALRRRLYVARRRMVEDGTDSVSKLSISVSPVDETELWIYPRDLIARYLPAGRKPDDPEL